MFLGKIRCDLKKLLSFCLNFKEILKNVFSRPLIERKCVFCNQGHHFQSVRRKFAPNFSAHRKIEIISQRQKSLESCYLRETPRATCAQSKWFHKNAAKRQRFSTFLILLESLNIFFLKILKKSDKAGQNRLVVNWPGSRSWWPPNWTILSGMHTVSERKIWHKNVTLY